MVSYANWRIPLIISTKQKLYTALWEIFEYFFLGQIHFSVNVCLCRKFAKSIWRDSFVTLAMFPESRTYIGTRLLLHNICTLLPSNDIVFSFYSQTCPICLEDFREKEYVTVCPCRHGYHRQWVATIAMRICSHIWYEDKTLIVVNTTAAATLGTEWPQEITLCGVKLEFECWPNYTTVRITLQNLQNIFRCNFSGIYDLTLHTTTVLWRLYVGRNNLM